MGPRWSLQLRRQAHKNPLCSLQPPAQSPTNTLPRPAAQGYTVSGTNHGLETLTNDGKINSVTDYDGNEYPVVQIGSQCWLAENMRCTHSPSTGTYIVFTSNSTTNMEYTYTGKMARWFNNDSATYVPQHYGMLYNWNAAVDVSNTSYGELSINTSSNNAVSQTFTGSRQGICPRGWHVPSDGEWTSLTNYVSSQNSYQCGGNSSNIGKALAFTDNWTESTNSNQSCCVGYNQSSNNATGFSAMPVGSCIISFSDVSSYAYFWSSTQESSALAYNRYLYNYTAGVDRNYYTKNYGFSVRCVRD